MPPYDPADRPEWWSWDYEKWYERAVHLYPLPHPTELTEIYVLWLIQNEDAANRAAIMKSVLKWAGVLTVRPSPITISFFAESDEHAVSILLACI